MTFTATSRPISFVVRRVDDAHRAAADPVDDLVAADALGSRRTRGVSATVCHSLRAQRNERRDVVAAAALERRTHQRLGGPFHRRRLRHQHRLNRLVVERAVQSVSAQQEEVAQARSDAPGCECRCCRARRARWSARGASDAVRRLAAASRPGTSTVAAHESSRVSWTSSDVRRVSTCGCRRRGRSREDLSRTSAATMVVPMPV